MKKNTLLLLATSLFALAACGPTNSTDSVPDASTTQDSGSELPAWVDYAATVHLQLDYEGKDFFKDGVGQMKSYYAIDGDTAHFDPMVTTTSSERIKCRFYGIDTPESTGAIEPWGQAASKYTKSIPSEAIENGTVVVTGDNYSEYRAPTHDSTGERYLACIWVNTTKKNAPKEEMQLLNLMIVQEGYSWAKNTSSIPELSDTFIKAQQQASAYKLHVFSNEKDPDYPYDEEFRQSSLLDMQNLQKVSLASQLDGDYAYDGTKSMSLVSSANGVIGKFSDEVTSSEFKVTIRDTNGVAIEGTSYSDLSVGIDYLLAYDDLIAAKTIYLTGECANGVLATTEKRDEAAVWNIKSETGGVALFDKETNLYLGYGVDENHDPFVSMDDEHDYAWDYLGASDGLSLPLKNYYDNRKVAVQGTVIGFSNHILYIQDVYENEDTGEKQYASINIFVGMSPIPNKFTVLNTYIEVKGIAKDSSFGFQISDTNFPRVGGFSDDESSVILTAEENTDVHQMVPLDFTAAELSTMAANKNLDYFGTYISLEDPVTCSGGYIDGAEGTLYLEGLDFDIYLSFTYGGDPDQPNWIWNSIDNYKGKQFMLKGIFTIHKSTTGRMSYQVNPSNASELVCLNPTGE